MYVHYTYHSIALAGETNIQVPDKKPTQQYGLQGTNHLLPGFGKVYANLPTKALLKKDKVVKSIR